MLLGELLRDIISFWLSVRTWVNKNKPNNCKSKSHHTIIAWFSCYRFLLLWVANHFTLRPLRIFSFDWFGTPWIMIDSNKPWILDALVQSSLAKFIWWLVYLAASWIWSCQLYYMYCRCVSFVMLLSWFATSFEHTLDWRSSTRCEIITWLYGRYLIWL